MGRDLANTMGGLAGPNGGDLLKACYTASAKDRFLFQAKVISERTNPDCSCWSQIAFGAHRTDLAITWPDKYCLLILIIS